MPARLSRVECGIGRSIDEFIEGFASFQAPVRYPCKRLGCLHRMRHQDYRYNPRDHTPASHDEILRSVAERQRSIRFHAYCKSISLVLAMPELGDES